MKKIFVLMILMISSLSYSLDLKIKSELPEVVEKEIRSAVSSHSSSERKEYFDWYKDSYLSMMKKLNESGIPKQDADMIAKRLHSMYGANYPKQLSSLSNEIDDYNNLVRRIKEEQKAIQMKIEENNIKSQKEIRAIFENSDINKRDLENIESNAKKEFPDDYSLQKAYIKGAIQTYQELKNMIKK